MIVDLCSNHCIVQKEASVIRMRDVLINWCKDKYINTICLVHTVLCVYIRFQCWSFVIG